MKFATTILFILFISQTYAQQFDWAKQIGGSGLQVRPYSMALDSEDNIYVTGAFTGTPDFDPSATTFNVTAGGTYSAYVAKYDSLGSFEWAVGFDGNSWGFGIDVDDAGNVYVAASFWSATDFDTGAGMNQITPTGSEDAVVVKLDTSGSLIWVHHFENTSGSNPVSHAYDVVVDDSANVYVTGDFEGAVDFDPNGMGAVETSAGNADIFLVKLDSASNYQWSSVSGSAGDDKGYSIDYFNGDLAVTGFFRETVGFGSGTTTLTATQSDVFVMQYGSNGVFEWAKKVGGSSFETGNSVSYDNNGNICVTGNFRSTVDFDPGSGVNSLVATGGNFDAFILKLDLNGDFLWARDIGNSSDDHGRWLETGPDNSIYCVGEYIGLVDFDTGPNTLYLNTTGTNNKDIFILKLDSSGLTEWVKKIGGSSIGDFSYALQISNQGSVYSSGTIPSLTDMDTGSDTLLFTPFGNADMYLHKIIPCTNVTYGALSDTVCDSYNSPHGNFVYTSSGIYSEVINNDAGCDSIITLDLTVAPSTFTQINETHTLCSPYISPSGNYAWNLSGVYLDTVQSFAGCDSVIQVFLTTNVTTSYQSIIACSSPYVSPSGLYTWNTDGVYIDTIANVAGCDSIMTIDLTFGTPNSATHTIVACDSFMWVDSITYTTSNSSATYTLTNLSGCDSIITLDLTVVNSSSSTDIISACDSITWIDGITYTSSNNTATHIIPNVLGCDSLVALDLTITNSSSSTDVIIACDSFTWIDGNTYYSSNNTATYTYSAANGCDSLIELDLTINSVTSPQIDITACNSYLSPSGNYIWTQSGMYFDTLQTTSSCDSIIPINLQIDEIDVSITSFSNQFTVAEPGAQYQWIDCSDSSAIPGATSQDFEPLSGGDYAVIVESGSCLDTSDCITSYLELQDIKLNMISLYPNPTTGEFTVDLGQDFESIQIQIKNALGKTIKRTEYQFVNKIHTRIGRDPGLYFIELVVDSNYHVFPIIKN